MGGTIRALRGATTLDEDSADQMTERVGELLRQLLDRNGIGHDDLVSVIFTATADLVHMFPAAAARTFGLGDVPLLGYLFTRADSRAVTRDWARS